MSLPPAHSLYLEVLIHSKANFQKKTQLEFVVFDPLHSYLWQVLNYWQSSIAYKTKNIYVYFQAEYGSFVLVFSVRCLNYSEHRTEGNSLDTWLQLWYVRLIDVTESFFFFHLFIFLLIPISPNSETIQDLASVKLVYTISFQNNWTVQNIPIERDL